MINAFEEAVDGILPALDIVEGFKGGRGGTDEAYRTGEVGAVDRNVSPVVAGVVFLFIGGFVFLIHDHELEVLHRGKYGGARAHHDVRFAAHKGFPRIIAFPIGEVTMPNHGANSPGFEPRTHATDGLGRKGDLGNEEDHPTPLGNDLLDGIEVDLGLSGTGSQR